MDKTQVETRGEGMRALRRDAALGRHPRVAEGMASVEVRQGELAHEDLGSAYLLVDLDRLARAHYSQLRMRTPDPGLGFLCVGVDDHDRMARPDARLG